MQKWTNIYIYIYEINMRVNSKKVARQRNSTLSQG